MDGDRLPRNATELLLGDPRVYDRAADHDAVRRVGALTWLMTAVLSAVMLAFWPPTHALGPSGWAIALSGLAGMAGVAAATFARGDISLRASYAITLLDIALLGTLEWLAGPGSEYIILIALPVIFLGAAQAPRRVAAALVLTAVVELPALSAHALTVGIAAAALRLIVWVLMAGLALVWTAGVRWQRLALRQEQAHAQHLALHDPVTQLGNRRKLLGDLEAAVENRDRAVLALFDLNGFKAYNDSFGHPAGDALLTRLSAKLMERSATVASAYRMGGDEFCLLARGGRIDAEGLVALGADALTEQGHGFLITAAGGAAALPHEAADPVEALRLADGRMYANKHERRGRATTDGTQMLLAILQERDPELSQHADAVARLAARLGERLAVPEHERGHLVRAAELHDIGKLAVPDAILSKPGPLDEEEWQFMRRHTIIGERVMSCAPELAPVAAIVRSSHERIDGTGYPDGLRGDDIPLASRIVAVCDAYDAMSSDRAYRPALPPEEIVAELRRGAGAQFDDRVVAALIEILAEDRRLALTR